MRESDITPEEEALISQFDPYHNLRKSINVTLFEENVEDGWSLVEFVKILQGLLEKVPEELLPSAWVTFDPNEYPDFRVDYIRHETDEEMRERINNTLLRARKKLEERSAKERQTYLRLKSKYEAPVG